MRSVHLSDNLSGLTVTYGNGTNMSFHAHGAIPHGVSPKDAEWSYDENLVSMYFPVAPGERIWGVWVMTRFGGLATVAVRRFTTVLLTLKF